MQHHFSSYLISSYPILSYQRHVTNSWSTHVLTNTTHVLYMLLQTQAQSNMWPGFRVFRIVYKADQNMYRTLVLELTLLLPSLAKGNLSLWVRPNKEDQTTWLNSNIPHNFSECGKLESEYEASWWDSYCWHVWSVRQGQRWVLGALSFRNGWRTSMIMSVGVRVTMQQVRAGTCCLQLQVWSVVAVTCRPRIPALPHPQVRYSWESSLADAGIHFEKLITCRCGCR